MKKVYRLLILAAVVLLWGQMLEARAEGPPGDDPNFASGAALPDNTGVQNKEGLTATIQAIPAPGDFIVTDEGADALFSITPGGVVTTIASGSPLTSPDGIAMDGGGDFIIPDVSAIALFRVTPGGVVTVIAEGAPFLQPSSVTVYPGATQQCSLTLDMSYSGGNLGMDLTIGTLQAAKLNIYLAAMNFVFPLATEIPLPVIDPPFAIPTISFPLPSMGGVGGLVTMTTLDGGIICADWDLVDTGSPSSNRLGTLKELRNSIQGIDGVLSGR